MYQTLYQTLSGPVQAPRKRSLAARSYAGIASGCQGLSSLRSSAPGPMCAEECPLANARCLPSGSIRHVSAHGAGGTPRHPELEGFSSSHTITFRFSLSGDSESFGDVWVLAVPVFQHGSSENSTGRKTVTARSGLCTARSEAMASSDRSPSWATVRCDSHRTVSGFGDRVSHVIPFYFFPLFIMDDKKKTPSEKETNSPVKVFVLDDVSASIFAREVPVTGQKKTFYSVSFSRSYRDSKGDRQYVKTFNTEDLAKVVTVAQQAEEHIRSL